MADGLVLIGMMDSPFVRRAALVLRHQGRPFTRRPLSTFADFERVLAINPLGKVPILILEDGTALAESRTIVEWLEGTAPPGRSLTPSDPARRLSMLQAEGLAIGLADKAYERAVAFSRQKGERDPAWIARLERQLASVQDGFERMLRDGRTHLAGEGPSRADLALVAAMGFVEHKLPALRHHERRPALAAYLQRLEAEEPFVGAPYDGAEARASGWRPEER